MKSTKVYYTNNFLTRIIISYKQGTQRRFLFMAADTKRLAIYVGFLRQSEFYYIQKVPPLSIFAVTSSVITIAILPMQRLATAASYNKWRSEANFFSTTDLAGRSLGNSNSYLYLDTAPALVTTVC